MEKRSGGGVPAGPLMQLVRSWRAIGAAVRRANPLYADPWDIAADCLEDLIDPEDRLDES